MRSRVSRVLFVFVLCGDALRTKVNFYDTALQRVSDRSKNSQVSNSSSSVEPLLIAGVVSSTVWLIAKISGTIYRINRYAALRDEDKSGEDKLENERLETCVLLKSLYDGLRFQLHCLQAMLGALAGETLRGKLLDPKADIKEEEWLPWRSIITNVEQQLQMLFHTIEGGNGLCQQPVTLPVLHLTRQPAKALKFPRGLATATALLILAGTGKESGATGEGSEISELTHEFVSRFLIFSRKESNAKYFPRAGPLVDTSTGEKSWWALNPSTLIMMNEQTRQLVRLSALLSRVSRFSHPIAKPCMLLRYETNKDERKLVLCTEDDARLQDWMNSVNYYRCRAFIGSHDAECSEERVAIEEQEAREKWNDLSPTYGLSPKTEESRAWLGIPWRQRALEGKVGLDCQEDGLCQIEEVSVNPKRRTGILEWGSVDEQSSKASSKFYFLLWDDSFSWYDSVSSVEMKGEILMKDVMIDSIKLTTEDASRCFVVTFRRQESPRSYKGCALTEKEAMTWIAELRAAYAAYFGLHFSKSGAGGYIDRQLSQPVKYGSLVSLMGVTSPLSSCTWERAQVGLEKDRMIITKGGNFTPKEWPLTAIKSHAVTFGNLKDCHPFIPFGCAEKADMPEWAECFCLEISGEKNTFCVDQPADDRKAWSMVFPEVLEKYRDLDDARKPRQQDAPWGAYLSRNPFGSSHVKQLLNKLLEALPQAQLSGQAVMCPPSCACPTYAAPMVLEDLAPAQTGRVVFEVRNCNNALAEIRNVQFRLGRESTNVLELRLRGFTVLDEEAPDIAISNFTMNPAHPHLKEYLKGIAPHDVASPSFASKLDERSLSPSSILVPQQHSDTCDAAELADILRLLWRFQYHHDAEALSQSIPRQHGADVKSVVVLVLQPLLKRYVRQTLLHLPNFKFAGLDALHKSGKCLSCNAFTDCPASVLWRVLAEVESEELTLLEVFGSSSDQTDETRNNKFHRTRLEPSRAMLVASEFWRTMNEFGCAPTEVWHPLERACYTFCVDRKQKKERACVIKRQRWPGDDTCGFDMRVPPSHSTCQQTCRTFLPGNPGCELGNPTGLPQAVEDFYKQTRPDLLRISYTAFYSVPKTLLPSAQFFVQYPSWVLNSIQHNAVMGGVDKIVGIQKTGDLLAHGFTSLSSQVFTICGMGVSLASLLLELRGMYTTHRDFHRTKNYFELEVQEKLKEMQYVKCKLLKSMKVVQDELQVSGDTAKDEIMAHIKNSGEKMRDFDSQRLKKLVDEICSGPLPKEIPKSDCMQMFDKSTKAAEGSSDENPFTDTFEEMFYHLVAPYSAMSGEYVRCEELFPPARHDIHRLPLSSVKALWFQQMRESEEVEELLESVRLRSNTNFEAIAVDTKPGERPSVDAKLGATGSLQLVLLTERNPSSLPIIQLTPYHVPQPAIWSTRSAKSVPSKDEYDMTVFSSMASEIPVGLAPGTSCIHSDNTTEKRCDKFSARFKHGALHVDSLRAGGFVDINLGCASHITVGRNESVVFGGGNTEVFLSSRSGNELPPIIDARVSKEPFSKELSEQGFVRLALDLNKECAAGVVSEKSYLYYRRQWVMRPSYAETMSEAERVKQKASKCLEIAQSLPMNPYSMAYSRRCLCCDCTTSPTDGFMSIGMVESYLDMGVENFELGGHKAQRQRVVYVGEMVIKEFKNVGMRENGTVLNKGSSYYACEARGIGQLWTMTQTLSKGTAPDKMPTAQGPPVAPEAAVESSVGPYSWIDTPNANDIYFNGEVHQYGDAELFGQHHKVPMIKAISLMCSEWESRLASIAKGSHDLRLFYIHAFRACLANADGIDMEAALSRCFEHRAVSESELEEVLSKSKYFSDLEDDVVARLRISGKALIEAHISAFKTGVMEETRCEDHGFVEYTPGRLFKNTWAKRRLSLRRVQLVTQSCKHAEKVRQWDLTSAKLSPNFEVVDFGKGSFGCFTLTAQDLAAKEKNESTQDVKLCAPLKEAERWHEMVAQVLIDNAVGPFPSNTSAWLKAATKMKCTSGENVLPEGIKPKLEYRLLPDGYGVLWGHDGANPIAKGKFARGAQVGIGERHLARGAQVSTSRHKEVLGDVTVGRFQRGVLSFGTSIMNPSAWSTDPMLKLLEVTPSETSADAKSLFGKESLVFTGYWLQTPTSIFPSSRTHWPAHLGVLRDKQLRPVYWGQFGLWLPHGLGVWCDHEENSMFRGVIKKEYQKFSVGIESASYVPLLLGELTRLKSDDPISDADVLKYDTNKLPASVKHASELYFAQGEPQRPGSAQTVCRSKALFQWDEWLERSKRLVRVWEAIADGTSFDYQGRMRVTAMEQDINRPGRNIDELLNAHTMQFVHLRRHLKNLKETDREKAELRLLGALKVLTEAEAKNKEFDEWDPDWMDSLHSTPELLHIAAQLQQLGRSAYMQFNSIASFISATDMILDFATSSYCMLCFQGKGVASRHANPSTQPKITIIVSYIRGLNVGKARIRIRVGAGNDWEEQTSWKQVQFGEARWGETFTFDGKRKRLDASTWVEMMLLHERWDKHGKKYVSESAYWKQRLVSIVGRNGELEWLRLTPLAPEAASNEDSLQVRAAVSVANTAAIFDHVIQNVIPEGCGATYAVRRLLERNELRLRRMETTTQTMERDAGEMTNLVKQDTFEESSALDQSEEHLPDPGLDPPRAELESSLHDDVFGGSNGGGIFTEDGPSVTLYKETHQNTSGFFNGIKFFAQYIQLSNPAHYHAASLYNHQALESGIALAG